MVFSRSHQAGETLAEWGETKELAARGAWPLTTFWHALMYEPIFRSSEYVSEMLSTRRGEAAAASSGLVTALGHRPHDAF